MARYLVLGLSLLGAVGFSCGGPDATKQKPTAPATTTAQQAPAVALNAQQQHGRDLYAKICAVCHGASGEGYKADQATALANQDFLANVTNHFLRNAIVAGRPGSTMSAWSSAHGGPLSAGDIEAIIAFIRSWQTGPKAKADLRPVRGDVKRGEEIYTRECTRCHGARGVGGPNVRIGEASFLRDASNGMLRQAISQGRTGTPMPAFEKTLGEVGIEDVVAYLRSLRYPPAPPVSTKPLEPHMPPKLSAPLPLPPNRAPLHPRGPEPIGFEVHPKATPGEVVYQQTKRGARLAILDARAPADYTMEHIAGAVSVPFYDPAPYFDKLPKDTWLVCYCACPSAESGALAQKLLDHGFKKVTVLAEGLGYYRMKDYPLEGTSVDHLKQEKAKKEAAKKAAGAIKAKPSEKAPAATPTQPVKPE